MIFFENERSKVRTLRVSFREIARIFGVFGVFDLGCYWLRLKFCEFPHLISVIFYSRFQGSSYFCTPHALKNANFRSKSPEPLYEFEGSSSFCNLSYPLPFNGATNALEIEVTSRARNTLYQQKRRRNI